MMQRIFLLVLTCMCLHAAAQDTSEVGTIKVIKKTVPRELPDTGRYKSPQPGYIEDGFIRCGYRSAGKSHHTEMFAGVQYFKYTYAQLGVQRTSGTYPSAAGINVEANFDKMIFGGSIFLQQQIIYIGQSHSFSFGASASAYASKGAMFYSASPYITLPLGYNGFNFQLMYGYNFLFGKDLPSSNEERGSVRGMNTHCFTLRYHFPFYL